VKLLSTWLEGAKPEVGGDTLCSLTFFASRGLTKTRLPQQESEYNVNMHGLSIYNPSEPHRQLHEGIRRDLATYRPHTINEHLPSLDQ
jgi:hypothetical protein